MSAPEAREARVVRRFDARRERVYDAWLDPAMLGHWMFGPEVRAEEIVRLVVHAHVGGAFSFVVRRGGTEVEHVGEYLALDRPRRLAFTWTVAGEQASSRVLVELAEVHGATEITLVHELAPEWEGFAERAAAAWGVMLDALAQALDGERGAGSLSRCPRA